METPVSKHCAPQKVEFVQVVPFGPQLHRLVLTVRWGLDNRRHQLLLDVSVAEPLGGGWKPPISEGPARRLVEKFWPEHVHALSYHGCSLTGPLHYIESTVFLAGARDCHGWVAGEHRVHRETGLPLWIVSSKGIHQVVASLEQPEPLVLNYEPQRVKKAMTWGPNKGIPVGEKQRDEKGNHLWDIPERAFPTVRSIEQPKPLVYEFKPYLGVGKEREFDSARAHAIWPDATNKELSVDAETLKQALNARLPKVLTELKKVVESFGMTF